MGWALGWLAVHGKSPEDIHQTLGLRAIGHAGDYTDFSRLDRRLLGRLLPSGWYLLISRDCAHKMLEDASMAAISTGCDAVRCAVEEHVMFAVSALWRNGAMVWLVEHESERGDRDLKAMGALPTEFEATVARITAESDAAQDDQADFFFDIPLILAKNQVGFRHDEGEPARTKDFQWLELNGQGLLAHAAKPWWRFWA